MKLRRTLLGRQQMGAGLLLKVNAQPGTSSVPCIALHKSHLRVFSGRRRLAVVTDLDQYMARCRHGTKLHPHFSGQGR